MPEWKPAISRRREALNVAVMGCIVNGPGESKHADIGISLPGTGEQPTAPVFIDGRKADDAARPDTRRGFPGDRSRLHRKELRPIRPRCRGMKGHRALDSPSAWNPSLEFGFKLERDVLESAPRRQPVASHAEAALVAARFEQRLLRGCDPQRKVIMAEQQAIAPGQADTAAPPEASLSGGARQGGFWTLLLGSIGVVYGDIGTSPLYAFKESHRGGGGEGGRRRRATSCIGVLSLILWSLVAGRHAQIRPRSCCAPTTTARAAR